MNKKEEFNKHFDRAVGRQTLSYMIVIVELPSGAKEMIVNTDRFHSKMDYYNETYNDNLELKNNHGVKIVGYLVI